MTVAPDAEIQRALDRVRARCDAQARREADPVGFVHRYDDLHDRELVALVASSIAFGNVKAIRAKLGDALERLGPSPSRAADDELGVQTAMRGWVHRVYRGEDVACLLLGARRVQHASGSLGARFAADLDVSAGDVRAALARFCDAIREAGGFARPDPRRRGPSHLLPDPRGASASKRLLLFLRWMVRRADGIDLGLWSYPNVDPSVLVIPVDTHIHKIAQNLGFCCKGSLSFKTAEEITSRLRAFDRADPVKYDFSLCHMGMLQRCPSRRDAARCQGCGVKPVCRHWYVRPTKTTTKQEDEKKANEKQKARQKQKAKQDKTKNQGQGPRPRTKTKNQDQEPRQEQREQREQRKRRRRRRSPRRRSARPPRKAVDRAPRVVRL